MVFDNSTPSLACIFVMDLLSLNSYCSAVCLYDVYGTYTNKLISITNGFFSFCQYVGGKNTRFERDNLQKLVDQIIKYDQGEELRHSFFSSGTDLPPFKLTWQMWGEEKKDRENYLNSERFNDIKFWFNDIKIK